MTWPMHDAGSTTPDPGPDDARRQEPPWPPEPPWPEEPPWPDQPGSGEPGPDPDSSRRGRHAAPDPLPPIEGLMPGGGPSPAETTLPLALKWPAPPTRPHRPSAPGPPGWRRVPRTSGYGQPGAGGVEAGVEVRAGGAIRHERAFCGAGAAAGAERGRPGGDCLYVGNDGEAEGGDAVAREPAT